MRPWGLCFFDIGVSLFSFFGGLPEMQSVNLLSFKIHAS